jgi:hypothetical protein
MQALAIRFERFVGRRGTGGNHYPECLPQDSAQAGAWQGLGRVLRLLTVLLGFNVCILIQAEPARGHISTAAKLAWVKRCQSGHPIPLMCLRVGKARVLHMPGELLVEYQLAAKAMRPDLSVMMAAYGDYGPGYIGLASAYTEGGYETSPGASNVSPQVESVLLGAVRRLLEVKPEQGPVKEQVGQIGASKDAPAVLAPSYHLPTKES